MAIRINPAHKGRLHRALGVPEDQPLSDEQLRQAAGSPDPHIRQMATFARNAAGWDTAAPRRAIIPKKPKPMIRKGGD